MLSMCSAQAYGYDYSAYGYPGYYDPADPYAGYYAAAYGQQYDPNAGLTAGDLSDNLACIRLALECQMRGMIE